MKAGWPAFAANTEKQKPSQILRVKRFKELAGLQATSAARINSFNFIIATSEEEEQEEDGDPLKALASAAPTSPVFPAAPPAVGRRKRGAHHATERATPPHVRRRPRFEPPPIPMDFDGDSDGSFGRHGGGRNGIAADLQLLGKRQFLDDPAHPDRIRELAKKIAFVSFRLDGVDNVLSAFARVATDKRLTWRHRWNIVWVFHEIISELDNKAQRERPGETPKSHSPSQVLPPFVRGGISRLLLPIAGYVAVLDDAQRGKYMRLLERWEKKKRFEPEDIELIRNAWHPRKRRRRESEPSGVDSRASGGREVLAARRRL
eukprot:TRINITY_DN1237_c0_g1_i1.p1 TRINITY_DN1237_c0_g1~~TRINITY_DN1237_c0_g1_i1.p1  ORF type:complete len:318 (-),score=54.40 TRINITY_DN1237_c0_g1_i1:288-1241(-)